MKKSLVAKCSIWNIKILDQLVNRNRRNILQRFALYDVPKESLTIEIVADDLDKLNDKKLLKNKKYESASQSLVKTFNTEQYFD